MDIYFKKTLSDFLNQNITQDFKIQNITTWRKYNTLKITLILKKIHGFANIEECSNIHKLIKIWIKKENIQEKTQIEVQSESIDKKLIHLQDFKDNLNTLIHIELKEKEYDKRNFKGFLIQIKNDMLILKDKDNDYALSFQNIKKAKIIPQLKHARNIERNNIRNL